MNDISMEERIAIRGAGRTLKKYGSTSNGSIKRYDSYVKHIVLQTDTLQGIALKYGVTTEQIRRANRLWTNDSLFLRKFLLIPVLGGDYVSTPTLSEIPTPINDNNNHSRLEEDKSQNDYSFNDFLVKMDCAIASTKSQVLVSKDKSKFIENEDSIFVKKKNSTSRIKKHQNEHQHHTSQSYQSYQSSSSSSGESTTDIPQVVMTQGRKVFNSLQKLEKERDDLFEL